MNDERRRRTSGAGRFFGLHDWRSLRWIIAGLIVVGAVIAILALPIERYTRSTLEWTESLGGWAYLVVTACYVVATVLFLPGLPLTLAAGFLFGLVAGTAVVCVGSILGAASAFLIGRYLLRSKIEKKMASRPRFRAIYEAIGRQGFRIVLLTRLSPVFPFNIQNYAYGLTKIGFWPYIVASAIGMFPGTVGFVYLGSTARNLAQISTGNVEGGWIGQVLKFGGIVITAILVVYVARVSKKALQDSIK